MDEDIENRALCKFKEIMADENFQDSDLLRFLRARNLELDKAEQMLRMHLDWKKREQIDHAVDFDVDEIVQNSFECFYDGLDKEGRPALYLPVGRWPTRQFILNGYRTEMQRNIYRVMGNVIKVVESSNWDDFVVIIDLAGLTYSQIMHYESLQMTLRVFREYEQNFPERLHLAFVINAPYMLNLVFPSIKSILRGTTVDKLKIFDNSPDAFLPALLEAIPSSGFPPGFRKYNGQLLDSWCSANNY